MKKLNVLFIAALMLIGTAANAQFGIKLGANMSAIGSYGNSEEGESANLKLGYQGGIFYKANIGKAGVMIEINYEARGTVSKKDYTFDYLVIDPTTGLPILNPQSGGPLTPTYAVNQEANSVHNYVNIPLLFFVGGDRLNFYVGPNVGILLSGSSDFTRTIDIAALGQTTNTDLEDVDWLDYESFKAIFSQAPAEDGEFLNSLDIGINVGAMFNITESLFIDLRVNQGLMDVTNNAYDNSIYPSPDFTFASREDADRNLSIQASIGYQF